MKYSVVFCRNDNELRMSKPIKPLNAPYAIETSEFKYKLK
jgi:hypothetical protein